MVLYELPMNDFTGLQCQFWQLLYFTSKFVMSISGNYWILSAYVPKIPQDSVENWAIFYKFGLKFQEGAFITENTVVGKTSTFTILMLLSQYPQDVKS